MKENHAAFPGRAAKVKVWNIRFMFVFLSGFLCRAVGLDAWDFAIKILVQGVGVFIFYLVGTFLPIKC